VGKRRSRLKDSTLAAYAAKADNRLNQSLRAPADGISSTACVQLRNALGGSDDIYAELVLEDQ
jgi:hypothetical protein